jgi:hypothetical protein
MPNSNGIWLEKGLNMSYGQNILIIGSNASFVYFMNDRLETIVDNQLDVVLSIEEAMNLRTDYMLVFLSGEMVNDNHSLEDLRGMRAVQQKFPHAGIIVCGEDDMAKNLMYVAMGARDYLSRAMLALPNVNAYLKKRLSADWAMMPFYEN